MCVYCLLYSYYDCEAEKEEKQTILEHIIANCQANSKICISLLFDIFFSINQTDKNINSIIRKLKNKLYLPYINFILDTELNINERNELINKSFLKDYDYYMEKVIKSYNVYKGLFLLLPQLYQSKNEMYDIKYPPFLIVKELYFFLLFMKKLED